MIEHRALLTACELPLTVARFGVEIAGLGEFKSLRGREGFPGSGLLFQVTENRDHVGGLGIVVGRALWDHFAGALHVVPQPTVPALTVTLERVFRLRLAG